MNQQHNTSSDNPKSSKPASNLRELKVKLSKVFFTGQNQFSIVQVKIVESDKPKAIGNNLTCKGILYPLDIGLLYLVKGEPAWNKKYFKWELNVKDWQAIEDKTAKGLTDFLRRECPHVQEARAKKLVEIFGTTVIEQLANPDKMGSIVVGLNVQNPIAQEIQVWAKGQLANARVKRQLYGLGLTPALVSKIIGHFGNNAAARLDKECFELTEVVGIGFLTVCKIADAIGIPHDRSDRVQAGILYYLKHECEQHGHTCIPQDRLLKTVCNALEIGHALAIKEAKELISTGKICTDHTDVLPLTKNKDLFEKEEDDDDF